MKGSTPSYVCMGDWGAGGSGRRSARARSACACTSVVDVCAVALGMPKNGNLNERVDSVSDERRADRSESDKGTAAGAWLGASDGTGRSCTGARVCRRRSAVRSENGDGARSVVCAVKNTVRCGTPSRDASGPLPRVLGADRLRLSTYHQRAAR